MPPLNYFSHETFSSILGSVSITAWIVVFVPQIYTNFHHRSADGLSLSFVVIWLVGDFFNIIGAWLQDVIWVMIVLAVYYTVADIVLLAQCLLYRPSTKAAPLPVGAAAGHRPQQQHAESEIGEHDPTQHASAATPLIPKQMEITRSRSTAKSAVLNICALLAVCTVGTIAWYVGAILQAPQHPAAPADPSVAATLGALLKAGRRQGHRQRHPHSRFDYSIPGQIFGWLCALTYLGSRLPQIVHNHRRRSTEGLSSLFFMFACLGNVTYVGSILVREWGAEEMGKYLAVNASWLAGSGGTLFLDFVILGQTVYYRAIVQGKTVQPDFDHPQNNAIEAHRQEQLEEARLRKIRQQRVDRL